MCVELARNLNHTAASVIELRNSLYPHVVLSLLEVAEHAPQRTETVDGLCRDRCEREREVGEVQRVPAAHRLRRGQLR